MFSGLNKIFLVKDDIFKIHSLEISNFFNLVSDFKTINQNSIDLSKKDYFVLGYQNKKILPLKIKKISKKKLKNYQDYKIFISNHCFLKGTNNISLPIKTNQDEIIYKNIDQLKKGDIIFSLLEDYLVRFSFIEIISGTMSIKEKTIAYIEKEKNNSLDSYEIEIDSSYPLIFINNILVKPR